MRDNPEGGELNPEINDRRHYKKNSALSSYLYILSWMRLIDTHPSEMIEVVSDRDVRRLNHDLLQLQPS